MTVDRRDFLKNAAIKGAAVASLLAPGRVMGANDRVRIGIVGLRGRGFDHIKRFKDLPNLEIAAVCDIDEAVIRQRLGDIDKFGLAKPVAYGDIRKLLDDKSIDAVSIATPNHWHSLMAIWACQAGKDVYVEKPMSHNWWEGRQLVAAAKRHDRVVQVGMQSRSSIGINEAMNHMRGGLIGDVYLSRGLCYKWRDTIGRKPVEAVPAGVNYDLWLGPAPDRGFTRNRFHYNWHWFWDTGNGDIGNQGIHEVDIARWGLGVKFPNKVSAIGGHVMFSDDQETPNVLNVAYQFDQPDGTRKLMEFEVRHWISNHEAEIGAFGGASSLPPAGLNAAAKPAPSSASLGPVGGKPNTIGNLFYGSKGYLAIQEYETYKSWLGEKQEPGPSGHGKENHFANFIDCVRAHDRTKVTGPPEDGHISATLMHLANVSYRLGRTLHFDPETEQAIGDADANRMLRDGDRGYRAPFAVPENL